MDHRTAPDADGAPPRPLGGGGTTRDVPPQAGSEPTATGADEPTAIGAGEPTAEEAGPLPAVDRAARATDDLVAATTNLWQLTSEQLVAAVETQHTRLAQEHGIWLAMVRELDTRGHHTGTGATSTAAWLAHHLVVDRHVAAADVAAARALDPDGDLPPQPGTVRREAVTLAPTARALLGGDISRAHADAIRHTVTRLPTTGLPPAQRDELLSRAETTLLAECHRLTPAEIRLAGTHLRHLVDPDGVLADERTAEQRAVFWIRPEPDGPAYRFGGTTDPVTAAQLTTFIDAHAAPRPAVDPDTGAPARDPRTRDERRGQAFTDLVRLAVHADPGTSGGLTPHVVVTTSLETLRTQLGERGQLCATTETGQPLSAGAVRTLACDTTVIPVVLGAASEPLDVGRATRTIPTGIRRALVARDRHCAFPGCDRPPRWADAHHIRHWADGGPTSLANLVLLCHHHHDTVHHTGWTVTVTDGRPRFTPPMRT